MILGQVFNETHVIIFGLIWLRMLSFIISSAFLGSPSVNLPVKILFSVVLTFMVFPFTLVEVKDIAQLNEHLILFAFREVIVGLLLGLLTRFFFFALSMAGELISMSLGLGSAQVYNPFVGASGQVVEQFYSLLGMVIFLALNGHHLFIQALVESFEVVSLAQLSIEFGGLGEVSQKFQGIFVMMIKMAAPVVCTIFIVNIAMAIVGRAVPQLNVLVTSFPVTIIIGITVLTISLPLMTLEMNMLLEMTSDQLFKLMRSL